MFKFEVHCNDQTVYELKTQSGRSYFVRCPGERSFNHEGQPRDGMLAFQVTNGHERTVMLHDLDRIVSATPRPDMPSGKNRPERMSDLFFVLPGEGSHSFLSVHLE